MSRFDYVKYDDGAMADQDQSKRIVMRLEQFINSIGYAQAKLTPDCLRAKAIAMTKLEECYMWIGKAIRDDQIARNGSAPLQEERKDG
jgi:hypothetical protein